MAAILLATAVCLKDGKMDPSKLETTNLSGSIFKHCPVAANINFKCFNYSGTSCIMHIIITASKEDCGSPVHIFLFGFCYCVTA